MQVGPGDWGDAILGMREQLEQGQEGRPGDRVKERASCCGLAVVSVAFVLLLKRRTFVCLR